MSNEAFYTIEKIIDRKKFKDKYKYKIKWKGFPMEQCTWEPIKNLQYALGLVDEYNKNHPIKKKNKKIVLLNKKRKENNEFPKNESLIQIENTIKSNYNNNNEEKKNNIIDKNAISSHDIDISLKKVVTVREYNNILMAVVDKIQNNGSMAKAFLPTEELKILNPWILLDFYESKIKFT